MSAKDDLIEGLTELGLSSGDSVLIHSSLIHFDYTRFGGIEEMAEALFDSLKQILGSEGNIIVPTFTLSWVEEHPTGKYVHEETKSEMGVFTELVRNDPDSVRTLHPHNSFAVYGNSAEELGKIHSPNTYGRDYIFGKIHDMNTWIMSFGLPYNDSFTYFHYIEQQKDVDYRYKKWFSGQIEVGNKQFYGEYSLYVRDLFMGVETNINPMGNNLEQKGVIETKDIVGGQVKVGRAEPIFNTVYNLMNKNEDDMYYIED